MKKLINNLIIYFSYKNPHLWLEINETIFDEIADCKKKSNIRMKKNIKELIEKLK